jgi:hypothetical protein
MNDYELVNNILHENIIQEKKDKVYSKGLHKRAVKLNDLIQKQSELLKSARKVGNKAQIKKAADKIRKYKYDLAETKLKLRGKKRVRSV